MDCQKAKSFFAEHNIDITIKDISNSEIINEMKKKYNRVMTPTIVISGETFIGFEQNIDKIKKIL
jgi:glutaredoxin